MSSLKNFNECNGCIIIDNDQNISLPSVGKTNAYDINLEKPCFFINNHYISPLLRSYSVTLPNPVSLEKCDELKIHIKIQKNILGKKYGYNLDSFVNELRKQSVDFKAGLRLKSSDGCLDITRCFGDGLDIHDYCGWIIITLSYKIGDKTDSTLEGPNQICNLCEISYSLCFEPVKIKVLYGQCDKHVEENVDFPMETCLELTNNSARREHKIDDKTVSGPENFLCLVIDDETDVNKPVWSKSTNTLTMHSDTHDSDLSMLNINRITEDKFVISGDSSLSFPQGTYRTVYSECK